MVSALTPDGQMGSNAAFGFCGIKQSGVGKQGGPGGIDEYLTRKYLSVASPPVPRRIEMDGRSKP
jgi:acyl-CoA reductase-like NAD-dependent aldehyde dehydrogenase